jgi:hypothetical protein
MPPPADVPGGGKRYRNNGAIRLTALPKGKVFGEQCVFDDIERNGWVAIAEGPVRETVSRETSPRRNSSNCVTLNPAAVPVASA